MEMTKEDVEILLCKYVYMVWWYEGITFLDETEEERNQMKWLKEFDTYHMQDVIDLVIRVGRERDSCHGND